jgi:hypothetical protein
MSTLRRRIEALEREQTAVARGSIAERMEAVRQRLWAMTEEQREAYRLDRLRRALVEPQPSHPIAARLWSANRREAERLGLTPAADDV